MPRISMLPLILTLVLTTTAVLAQDLPSCSSEIQQAAKGPYGSVCTSRANASDGTIIYATFCADSDCRVFYAQLNSAFTTDCTVGGVSLKNYLSRIAVACADITLETVPPSLTTAKPTPTRTPTPTQTTPAPVKKSNTAAIIAGIIGSVVAILVVIVVLLIIQRKRRQGKDTLAQGAPSDATYVAVSEAVTADTTQTRSIPFPESQTLVPYHIPYDRIQFGRVINHGGFGQIFRGTYEGKDVAIKRLLPARRDDPHCVSTFVKEIRLTAMLKHECIARFIGAAWEDASSLCMVSEFMFGGDLRTLLMTYVKSGHANGHDDRKLRIAIQIAHGMTYLHSLDPPVVHRDLKSRNILLTAALDAKIVDFGVSCERQDYTMTAGVGTSLWMAPEVMSGDRYDERADVFSFGVILSELDTHVLPYDHARDSSSGRKVPDIVLLEMIRHGRLAPRFTDLAHPAIVALARDCLQLDPKLRPTSVELLCRLNQCLRHDPTLTEETRTAMDRSLQGVEARRAQRPNFTMQSTTFQMGFNTRATTRVDTVEF